MEIDIAQTTLWNRVENALNKIRPFLEADGGNIELVNISEMGVAQVRLLGSCESCPMSFSTMKAGVETTVKNEVPEIKAVVAID
ncbi:MAG: NifU family protein [Chitinophagales bacterium]|jgi:Fe-S cluster biogenesis protein NfuA|nr:NifU family protein [Chitinophagales bacterium]MBP9135385.1 NifU family protein [Chitinophagales bacterium]